jgi:hypothetical protein
VQRCGDAEMLNNMDDFAKIVMYTANYPKNADPFDSKSLDEYSAYTTQLSSFATETIVETDSFFDFQQLLITGKFEGAIIVYPEYLSRVELGGLSKLIPNIGKLVNCLILTTHWSRSAFPLEDKRYGEIVKIHTPTMASRQTLFEYLESHLANRVTKSNLDFITRLETDAHSYTTSFSDFPPEVATACEQYLLYFRDFLTDVGLGCKVHIFHLPREVLFSVVPNNPDDALETIHTALQLYLQFPSLTDLSVQIPSGNIAVQRLQNELVTLKSRFRMAKAALQMQEAMIEVKDVTIREQDMTINIQNETIQQKDVLINKLTSFENPTEIFMSARHDVEKELKPTTEVYVFRNLFKLGEGELLKGAVKINLAEAYEQIRSAIARMKDKKRRDNSE